MKHATFSGFGVAIPAPPKRKGASSLSGLRNWRGREGGRHWTDETIRVSGTKECHVTSLSLRRPTRRRRYPKHFFQLSNKSAERYFVRHGSKLLITSIHIHQSFLNGVKAGLSVEENHGLRFRLQRNSLQQNSPLSRVAHHIRGGLRVQDAPSRKSPQVGGRMSE